MKMGTLNFLDTAIPLPYCQTFLRKELWYAKLATGCTLRLLLDLTWSSLELCQGLGIVFLVDINCRGLSISPQICIRK